MHVASSKVMAWIIWIFCSDADAVVETSIPPEQ